VQGGVRQRYPRLESGKAARGRSAAKGGDGGWGGGAKPERKKKPTKNGTEARTKRKLGFFLYALRVRGRKNIDNATRNNGGGISMVHRCGLKNLLMVKVRVLEILKLQTTRKKRTKDKTNILSW
jgi:hypothetical protein